MEFKTNIGVIMVTIIILIIALPKTGYLMDYRLDYCNDYDKFDDYNSFETQIQVLRDTEPVNINHDGFYACEIGFINANVEVTIDVLALNACDTYYLTSDKCNFEFFILNKDNYHNFLNGESYRQTNDLANIWFGVGSEQIYAGSSNLLYDTYYFVMNWEYRTTNGEEFSVDGSRDYGGAYTAIWEEENVYSFYYALDIDYTEDNLKGNL
tara:strand:- start:345 stop:974 length:630 start_codon:yes stop_codon:yes gene_type:complete